MKKIFIPLFLFLSLPLVALEDYFFPNTGAVNEDIPSLQEFLGYGIGDFHTRHDLIVAYFKELARLSYRVHIQDIGETYEQRSMIVATITSPENYANLENIRQEHLKLALFFGPLINFPSVAD